MLTGTNKANIDAIKPSANKQANARFLFKIILISVQWSELQNGVDGGLTCMQCTNDKVLARVVFRWDTQKLVFDKYNFRRQLFI